jgi:hypothetical protein
LIFKVFFLCIFYCLLDKWIHLKQH